MGLKRTSCSEQSALSPINRMVIVADFGLNVQRYRSEFCNLRFSPPRSCPHCAEAEHLIGHGSYRRTVCDEARSFVIRVKRFLCTLCRHTVSLLPSFCLPYRHYLTSTIQRVLSFRFEVSSSWKTIGERFSSSGTPGINSCREWIRSFTAASEVYLKHLLQQLAHWQLSPGKLELAIADVSAKSTSPEQLVAAVPHLLAWLQDNGLKVPEGPKRWLAVVWQWGHRVKLGRLV